MRVMGSDEKQPGARAQHDLAVTESGDWRFASCLASHFLLVGAKAGSAYRIRTGVTAVRGRQ